MLGMVSEKEKATEMLLVGDENPTSYENLPLSSAAKFKPFSKYPYIVRDIAFWAPAETKAEDVLQIIKNEAGELCVSVRLFDTFQKENKTSLAFRLVFQSFERTLTEAEVNATMEKITAALRESGFEVR